MHFTRLSSFCLCGFSLLSFAREAQKPNIILFLAYDVSLYDLGCYGKKEVNTLNIDGLVKKTESGLRASC